MSYLYFKKVNSIFKLSTVKEVIACFSVCLKCVKLSLLFILEFLKKYVTLSQILNEFICNIFCMICCCD